ncbi:hypothetical protein Unana1_04095 [Umbelopsis nana]
MEYLEKREQLGLDQSDSESTSDDEETKPKKKRAKKKILASPIKLPAAPMPPPDTNGPNNETGLPGVRAPDPASNEVVLLDSDDDRPSRTAPPIESSAPLPVTPVTSAAALTTPAVVTNQPPEPKPLQPEHSSLSIFDDFEDLDPGLASSLTETSRDRSTQDVSSQQSQASKITLRFQLKFYPPPADPILLEMGSNPHLVKILKVLVMDRDTLEKPIEAFLDRKRIAKEHVVFVYNNTKLWPIATPAGLGMKTDEDNHIDVYYKDQWQLKLKDDEINKQERLAQLRPDEQLSDDEIALPQGITTEAANETIGLRLTIRDKDGKDSKMKVKPTTTIGTLIKHYRTLNNMGDVPVKLMLDDEVLEDSQQIQDTDLEDEDMVSASW